MTQTYINNGSGRADRGHISYALDIVECGHTHYILSYGDDDKEIRDWEAEEIQKIVTSLAPNILVEIKPIDRRLHPYR